MLHGLPAIETAYWLSPALTVALAVVFGLLVGSFLNVVIHRLPKMMQAQWEAELAQWQHERDAQPVPISPGVPALAAAAHQADLASGHADCGSTPAAAVDSHAAGSASTPARFDLIFPRSRCPHCGHQITALENIPVLSWLALRGRCSACRAPISARYPAVELLSGVLAGVAIWWFGLSLPGIAAVGLSLALIALTGIDFDTQLLPDSITLPLLWAGLLVNLLGGFVSLQDAVVGAMAGYLVLWCIFHLFRLLTGKEGMGYGDFKLLAALGAWLGWKALPSLILLSSLVGAIVGIYLILFRRHGREVPIPFGPYLAGAGLLTLYVGPALNNWFGLH